MPKLIWREIEKGLVLVGSIPERLDEAERNIRSKYDPICEDCNGSGMELQMTPNGQEVIDCRYCGGTGKRPCK